MVNGAAVFSWPAQPGRPCIRAANRASLRGFLGVPERVPIDCRHPALFRLVVLHDRVGPQFVGPALVVGIVGVQGEGHPMPQLDPLALEIAAGAGEGQPQAGFVVQVLEVCVNARTGHRLAPLNGCFLDS